MSIINKLNFRVMNKLTLAVNPMKQIPLFVEDLTGIKSNINKLEVSSTDYFDYLSIHMSVGYDSWLAERLTLLGALAFSCAYLLASFVSIYHFVTTLYLFIYIHR